MGKIMGDAKPGSFVFGLVVIGVAILLVEPAGWAHWAGLGLAAFGGGLVLAHWGWWRDLSP